MKETSLWSYGCHLNKWSDDYKHFSYPKIIRASPGDAINSMRLDSYMDLVAWLRKAITYE